MNQQETQLARFNRWPLTLLWLLIAALTLFGAILALGQVARELFAAEYPMRYFLNYNPILAIAAFLIGWLPVELADRFMARATPRARSGLLIGFAIVLLVSAAIAFLVPPPARTLLLEVDQFAWSGLAFRMSATRISGKLKE